VVYPYPPELDWGVNPGGLSYPPYFEGMFNMATIKEINAKFEMLTASAKAAVNDLISVILQEASNTQTVVRAKKHGMENRPGVVSEDEENRPARRPGRPAKVKEEVMTAKKRGRPAKVQADDEEIAPRASRRDRSEKIVVKPAKVSAPVAKPAKVSAPVAVTVYAGINPVGKTKSERAEYLAASIKKVEKFVANDRDWHEAHAFAAKKGVDVVFGRGKPSDASNKRKIAIAMVNAGKL
jgi:hypothetical protein